MKKAVYLIFFLIFFLPCTSFAEQKLDDYFTSDKANSSIKNLFQDSSNYQLLAEKIIYHPKYKKTEQLSKDFDLYIRVTSSDINRFETINSERLYLRPANDRLYLKRYLEYMEYKNKSLELELAKEKLPQTDTSALTETVSKLEKRLNSYFSDDMWAD